MRIARWSLWLTLVCLTFVGCTCDELDAHPHDGGRDAASGDAGDDGSAPDDGGLPGDGSVGVPPSASADAYTTSASVTLVVAASGGGMSGLLANDGLGEPSAAIASFGGGSLGGAVGDHTAGSSASFGAGSLTVGADGGFSFTPDAGFTGTFTFSYRLQSSAGSADALVTLTVQAGPTAVADAYATLRDQALVLGAGDANPLANDLGLPAPAIGSFGGGSLGGAATDHAAGDAVTFGSAGSITLGADGALSFTPDPGTTGVFTVDYVLTNALGSSTATVTITVGEAPSIAGVPPDAEEGVAYSHAFTVGGFPAPTLSVSAGMLPPGLSLAGNAIGGTPTVGGSYSGITITASNGVGTPATITFSIEVAIAPSFTSAATTTFPAGAAGSFGITTLGLPTPTITLGGTLPSGVGFTDLGDGTATLAGTPAAGTGGTHALTLTASNGVGSDAVQSFSLVVEEGPTLSGTPPSGAVGTPYSHAFTVGGFPAPTLSVTAGTLPAGLSLVGNVITGTPSASGTSSGITVSASNGLGSPATLTFSITIQASPAITSGNAATFVAGASGTFTVTTTGVPTPTLSRSGTLPSGVSFVDAGNGTATLAGTPGAATGGTYPLTITASNGMGTNATQGFTLTVQQAPTLSGTPPGGQTGVAYSHAFTVGGFPAPTLSVTAGTLPAGLSLVGNAITGTPTTGGTYTGITVSASNGVGSPATLTFSIQINQAPTITTAASATFTTGSAGSFTVGTIGVPIPALSRSGTLPSGVSFVDAGNGTATLAGTPAAGTGGTYPLTITASNGVGTNATQAFTLTVRQAPSISGTPPNGQISTAYSHAFTVGGFPAPTLSVTAGALPPGLSLVGNSITGTPTSGGTYAGITVSASNGVGSPATITFSIAIAAAPTAAADGYPVTGNVSISVPAGSGVLANDTLNGATLTSFGPTASVPTAVPGTITTANGGVVVLAADGSFTFNPAAGSTASDQFFYRVTNGAGSSTVAVSLTISNLIWFVDGSAAGGGNGRLSNPFNTTAAAVTASGVGHVIYVYDRPATYAGTIALKASQRLIGQGVALDATSLGFSPAARSVTLPAAGANPKLGGTITLAASSGVFGVTVNPVSGTVGLTDGGSAKSGLITSNVVVASTNAAAVTLNGSGGAISLRSLSTTSGVNGLVLTNTTGTFAVTGTGTVGSGGTITGTTGNAVSLTNAAGVSLSWMTIQNAPYDNANAETTGNGVFMTTTGAGGGGLTVDHASFSGNGVRDAYLHALGSGATSFAVTSSTGTTAGGNSVLAFYDGSSNANSFRIQGNSFTGATGAGVQVVVGTSGSAAQTVRGHVDGNTITGPIGGFSNGISVGTNDNAGSTLVVGIDGNVLQHVGSIGIDVNHQPLVNNLHATLTNNAVVSTEANYSYGIRTVFASSSTPIAGGTMCVRFGTNDIPAFPAVGSSAYFLRKLGTHPAYVQRIEGFTGNTQALLTTFLTSRNTAASPGIVRFSPDPVTSFDFVNGTCLVAP